MNNMKNKNIMKSSFFIIILGMSMAERVCGMEDKVEHDMNFTKKMCDAFMEDKIGKDFVKKLCNIENFTVNKGGFCGDFVVLSVRGNGFW